MGKFYWSLPPLAATLAKCFWLGGTRYCTKTLTHCCEDCFCRSLEIFRGAAKGEGSTQNHAPECQVTNFRSDLGNSRHKPFRAPHAGCTSSVRAIGCKPVTTGKEARNIVQQRL
jgi:hypothetical protein